MKRHGRSMRYRKSIYRKNGIHIYLLIALCSALAVVVLFVIVGNALGKRVEASEEQRSKSQTTAAADEPHATPKSIDACTVPLSANNSNLSTRLKNAAENGYSSACFELDTKEGTLLYQSKVAVSMGYLDANAKLWKLSDAMELFSDNGIYSVGIIHLSRMNIDNDLDRNMAAGYYASLAAEAIRSGVSDIMLYPTDMPAERYGELASIAAQIHGLCDGSTVGVALPPSLFSSENGSEAIDMLWGEFDYIAVDLSQDSNDGETVPQKINRELGGMLYYLLRYNIRVLVPNVNDTELASQIKQAVISNGSQNIQIMP